MANLYPYFIASLPMLQQDQELSLSSEEFLRRAEMLIPQEDYQALKQLPETEDTLFVSAAHPLVKEWISFDTSLRNELVRVRAGRKHLDAAKYLRPDGYSGSALVHLALAAQRNPLLLEAEKLLDQARWSKLEELSFGHYFDLEYLIVYAYKLRILERWEKIRRADKKELLEKTACF